LVAVYDVRSVQDAIFHLDASHEWYRESVGAVCVLGVCFVCVLGPSVVVEVVEDVDESSSTTSRARLNSMVISDALMRLKCRK